MKYYGQFGIDKFLHETFFNKVSNGFFVECGAVDGVLESTCKFFEETLNWTGINIEASPPLYSMLVKNRPYCINLNIGLSNCDEKLKFTHAIHPVLGNRFGNGSFSHCEEHKNDLINKGCSFKDYNIDCKKFSSIYNQDKEIDLFVLDVEGHEVNALKGIIDVKKKYLPKIFCIEHSFSGIDNITDILRSNYELYSIERQNAIYKRNF